MFIGDRSDQDFRVTNSCRATLLFGNHHRVLHLRRTANMKAAIPNVGPLIGRRWQRCSEQLRLFGVALTAYDSITSAVEGVRPHHSLAIRPERSSLGPLTCLVLSHAAQVCLMSNGHLASYTGEGYVGFEWTNARLVSEQPTAPAADFKLSGVPREPYVGPLE